ncbi:hypothetical protein M441DRAFT_63143 [Trichoderma asperellum CBS 433.97]|uniref:Peptidase S53 activation domain-containing protein n=2 Tax=Trichoderma asperellum TaxID=101201 RepID=A0A2T3YQR5_TRIA4|nr:hypothetical protein M441DRAFT_63143 [Trichoderma asperellum CBS 433.97]PTB34866.1 hypothetical protein M441DRAFT_63143 [Trichoderma asperellum CBS 433.97]
MFAPADETVSSVISWLLQAGINSNDISLGKGKHWMTGNVTVSKAKQLPKTQYYVYDNGKGRNHTACEQYHLPSDLSANAIDLIFPTIHLDAKLSLTTSVREKKRENSSFSNKHRAIYRPVALVFTIVPI